MKKLNILSTFALVSLMVGGLASCGGNQPTGGESEGDVIKIPFWTSVNQTFHDEISRYVRDFEDIIYEQEHVKIQVDCSKQGGYEDIEQKIFKGLTSGIYPTIAIAYPDTVANLLKRVPEKVVNIEPLMNDPEIGFGNDTTVGLDDDYKLEEAYISAFVEEGTKYDTDGIYSFPFLKSTEIMAYNKDIIESISIPSLNEGRPLNAEFMSDITWDEFVTILEYIGANSNGKGDDSFGDILWPACYDSDSNFFITKMMQNDIPFIQKAELPNEKVLFNNERAKQEIRDFKALHEKGLITTKGVEGQYGNVEFKKGNILFDICSSGGVGYLDLSGGIPVEVVKVPYDNKPLYVSQGPTVTFLRHENKPNDDLRIKYAYKLIKYLTNVKNNAELAVKSGGYVPVNKLSYDTRQYKYFLYDESKANDILSKNARTVIEQVKGTYYNLPCFKGSADIRDYVGGIVTKTLTGSDIDEEFANAYNSSVLACK